MLLFQVDLIIAIAFYMVCQSINSTSYNMNRTCVLDWYVMTVKQFYITLSLVDLNWLPVKFTIEFKILLIVFKILGA